MTPGDWSAVGAVGTLLAAIATAISARANYIAADANAKMAAASAKQLDQSMRDKSLENFEKAIEGMSDPDAWVSQISLRIGEGIEPDMLSSVMVKVLSKRKGANPNILTPHNPKVIEKRARELLVAAAKTWSGG